MRSNCSIRQSIRTAAAALLLSAAGTALADAPRLQLFITAPIGASDAGMCYQPTPLPARLESPPKAGVVLTEQDVVKWERESGRWTIDPARFAGDQAGWKLADHCFVLAIDGRVVTNGVVLWSHSERLIRFPTVSITADDKLLVLQLTSEFGVYKPLLQVGLLSRIFDDKPQQKPAQTLR